MARSTRVNFDAIRDHLFDRVHKNGEQIKNDFPNILRTAIRTETWKHYQRPDGRAFENLVEWMQSTWPNGVGMGQGQHALTYEDALQLTEGATDVHRVLLESAPRNGRGGDRRSESARQHQSASTHFGLKRAGSRSATVLSVRLAQEKPKFYDRYLSGQYKSVTAAATAAGLLKDNGNMRRLKSAWRKSTAEERREFLEWMKKEAGQG